MPTVQMRAASDLEYNVAIALDKFGIEYDFQYPLFGGTRFRGGLIVDFVVYKPFPTPVEVFGQYWHTGTYSEFDRFKIAVEFQYFGREPIVFLERDVKTPEQAERSVRREFL